MQKITSLPADDALPGWYHTSQPRTPRPAHVGQKHARWAIVGAGLTGLAAARQLALNFPNDEVVLIEAQDVGFDPPGATPVLPLMCRTISGPRTISVTSPPPI